MDDTDNKRSKKNQASKHEFVSLFSTSSTSSTSSSSSSSSSSFSHSSLSSSSISSSLEYRQRYSLLILRLVNGLLDPLQQQSTAQSIAKLAQMLKLPSKHAPHRTAPHLTSPHLTSLASFRQLLG